MSLFLISCPARPANVPDGTPAREAYGRSTLFRFSLAYAEAQPGARVLLLHSAAGLLLPSDPVPKVSAPLSSMRRLARDGWGRSVAGALATREVGRRTHVVLLAPRAAVEVIAPHLSRVEMPLAGLGIGQQLRWLRAALAMAAWGPVAPPEPAAASRVR